MMDSDTTPTCQNTVKRERKANFADIEVRVLVDLYQQHRSQLTGKFSNILTQRQKAALWQEIALGISACGFSSRSIADVRKKWTDVKRAALRASGESKRPKTGVAQKLAPPWFTDIVLDALGELTTLITRIEGEYLQGLIHKILSIKLA